MTISPKFRGLKNIYSPLAKRPDSHSRSDHFLTFRSLKKRFLAYGDTAFLFSRNDHFPTFRSLKNFSSPQAKRPDSRSRSDHFWTFRNFTKRFLVSGETAGLPFAKYPFFPMFRSLKNISLPPAKRPRSRSRSDHFLSFRSLRKRILASGETAGLPFAK